MRSVDGQAFTFDWNPALGWNSVRAEEAWPGDDYVDVVGIDVYDWVYGEGALSPEDRWDRLLTMEYGLDWFASFAAEHGKPLSVPEWGLASANSNGGGGGGDDPLFVRNLAAWMSEHRVVYEAYFDVDLPGGERHALTAFPTAATAYRELFGSAAG